MKERKRFIGRINSDADNSVFPEDEFLNCQNVSHVIAQDGSIAAMKPVKGNRPVKYIPHIEEKYPVGGKWKIVGSFSEDDKNRLYYFAYNEDEKNHHLLCYFKDTNDIKLVFHGEILGFRGLPITGIDKVGDILYWAEEGNQPRKVNVERGMKTFDLHDTELQMYENPTTEDITIIKRGPEYAPIWNKATTEQPYNFVDDYAFQFSFQYVYRDKELSVFSPYSKVANYNDDEDTYDTIVVQIPTAEAIPYEVDKIRLAVRDGNTGSFFIIKQWIRSEHGSLYDLHNSGESALSYTFYNNQNGVAVSEEESAKPFDQVPLTSKALVAAKNRLFLGNNVLGYNAVNRGRIKATYSVSIVDGGQAVIVSAKYVIVKMTQIPTSEYPYPSYYERVYVRIENAGSNNDGYYSLDTLGVQGYGFDNQSLPANIILSTSMKVLSLSEGDQDFLLIENLQKDTAGYNVPVQEPIEFNASVNREYAGTQPKVGGLPGSTTSIGQKAVSFKSGSKYQVGIVFYDKYGRNAGVYSTNDCMVSFPDRTYLSPNIYQNIEVSLEFLSNEIPEWASTYQILRTRNLTYQSFIQGDGNDIQYIGKNNEGVYVFGESSTQVFTEIFDETRVQGVALNISTIISRGIGYVFNEGDYVKLYFVDNRKVVLQVVDQVGSFLILESRDLGTLPLKSTPCVFEIASPRKGMQEETYYEVGSIHSIVNPGKENRSLKTTSVIITGDTHVKTRGAIVEAMNPNDNHWKEWLSDIGRPNAPITKDGQSIRETSICYSNVFLQDTEVNGLSSFDTLDYKDLDYSMGPIRKLVLTNRVQEYGSVMLAICESETASIYLGENRIVDNADVSILATSGDVIGTVNILKGSNGTIHPESVYEKDGLVFFVNSTEGVVVQYDNNGLNRISENGMAKFFSGLLYEVKASDRRFVGTVDKSTGAYMVHIPSGYADKYVLTDYTPSRYSPHHLIDNAVYSYLPQLKGWNTVFTFAPEWMDCLRDTVISFKEGVLHVHDSNSKNNFYGIPNRSVVSFVVGSVQAFVKTPEAIAIEGTNPPAWVHLRNEHPYIQSTDIEDTEFVSREGVHVSSFFRDRFTPGYAKPELALVYGEPVRGQFLKIALSYEPTDFHVSGVTITYDRSLGNNIILKE